MTTKTLLTHTLLALTVTLDITASVFAQQPGGSIRGTVVDPSGALVPRAHIDPAARPLLLAAIGDGIDQGHGPPLELIFIAIRKHLSAFQIFRSAVNIEDDVGECVFQALFDE